MRGGEVLRSLERLCINCGAPGFAYQCDHCGAPMDRVDGYCHYPTSDPVVNEEGTLDMVMGHRMQGDRRVCGDFRCVLMC